MSNYENEKFQIGDSVYFDVFGTELKGTGEILGKALGGICPMWMVLIKDRPTEEMKQLKEKALIVQENFIVKIDKFEFGFEEE
jgi:hypothetical protein